VSGADAKAKTLKPADLVDTSLMDQIKAEGFFKQLGIELK
jgi:hypothetical protein